MVYPFNDTCFFGKVGDIKTVTTQFGVHLVKIVGKGPETRKVTVSSLERVVEPSQNTFDGFYRTASEFAGKNRTFDQFKAAVTTQSLVKRVSPALKETEKNIPGLENARRIIRWAYNDAEKNEVSDVFDLEGKFIVAVLTEVKEKGIATLDQVKDLVTTEVRKEKKAKIIADKFNASMKNASTLDAIAKTMELKLDTANNVTFSATSIPQVGFEPALIVASVVKPKGKISEPITGKNGVFVVYVDNKISTPVKDTKNETSMLNSQIQSRVDYEVYEALKKAADIKDYRIKFF
jgi:peptidyl-prolyl cis-trans isomerase D